MGKTVAIVQSNYVPWKGYFDLIRRADEFVLYDDVQYTRRDWRNRNRIKTADGVQWLTIPVEVKGKYVQRVREQQQPRQGEQDRHRGAESPGAAPPQGRKGTDESRQHGQGVRGPQRRCQRQVRRGKHRRAGGWH